MIIQNAAMFYEQIRLKEFDGVLRQTQLDGIETLLTAVPDGWDQRWVAYMLATAFWETNRTMQPVREAYWVTEAWRRAHLRYYPYYGRGYCQLTWRANYEIFSRILDCDLVGQPDKALEPETAAKIIVFGMEHGTFTGMGLGTYFNKQETLGVDARRIINGSDHAEVINQVYLVFLQALTAR